jgi:hypothetical protein
MSNRGRLLFFVFVSLVLSTGAPIAAFGGTPELSPTARAAIAQAVGADLASPPFEEAKLASGQENDAFGNAVAISGDTIVVGAPFAHPAAVYVFVKPASGWEDTSTFDAKLTEPGGVPNDGFGQSVAISGDTVFAAASQLNSGSKGAVYVYVRPAAGWTSTSAFDAKLTAFDGSSGDGFGAALAISDDTLIVGAFNARVGGSRRGALYVFEMPASGWASTSAYDARLTVSGGAVGDAFGISVAVAGDTVVAGSSGAEDGHGAAFVFVKPVSGWNSTSSFAAKLTASDGQPLVGYGQSIAISEEAAVVSAPFARVGVNAAQGAVYVFEKPDSGWASTSAFDAKLTAANGAVQDYFGLSVALSGRTVAAGAPSEVGLGRPGSVYVFVRPSDGWASTSAFDAKLTASDSASSDFFGFAVAVSSRELVASALGANLTRGGAYVFQGLPPA